jgi:hypothetical protein
MMNLA